MPERIILGQTDDLRDVVHRAVACLAQGGIIALGTDSGTDWLASALNPSALGRITGWAEAVRGPGGQRAEPAERSAILLLRSSAELADWALLDPAVISARQLPGRVWPGAVILQVTPKPGGLAEQLPGEVRSAVSPNGLLKVWSPAERMIREMLRLSPGPLIYVEGPDHHRRDEDSPPTQASGASESPGPELILDFGQVDDRLRPTVVALEEGGWAVIRPGSVPAVVLEQWAGIIILFVCTGNTCRSPMAEALCKVVLARRVDCPIEDLPRRGYYVTSAGVAAGAGMAAALNAIEVVRGRGGSLDDHQSQPVTPEIVRRADHILAMTWDHLDALLDQVPEAGHRVRLLDPAGGDIPDPVGEDLTTYRATAREIERHLEHLLGELGF